MDSHEILQALYESQGASDPKQPQSQAALQERMAEIFARATDVMRRTGFVPDRVSAN